MKNLFALITAVIISASAFAQAPQKMSYQAVIRDDGGALVVQKMVSIRISVLVGSETDEAIYVETHAANTNANGLVSLEIGGGRTISGNFASIDWSSGLHFIKTETDPNGGSNYSISGSSQLLSVPYAMHAITAERMADSPSENKKLHRFWKTTGNGSIDDDVNFLGTTDAAALVIKTDNIEHARLTVHGDFGLVPTLRMLK